MKRTFMVALAAILFGGATGFGISSYENSLEEFVDGREVNLGKTSDDAPDLVSTDAAKRPAARVVGSDTHDFGSMSITEGRDHTFQVRNGFLLQGTY